MCDHEVKEALLHREELGNGAYVWTHPQYKFGTDAMLLARFALACAPHAARAADLGTGCGIIPVVWAQECPDMQIFAAEIQPQAAALARRSAFDSGFAERITVWEGDLRQLRQSDLPQRAAMQLVSCNPPYFLPGSGYLAGQDGRRIARAEESCTVYDAAAAAARLLNDGGWFCMIHRTERLTDALDAMRCAGVEPKRLQLVQTAPTKAPKLFLVGGRRSGKPGLDILPNLVLNQ
jgi:tRNA1(Val) A37 N6-methylase TrmN6